MPKVTRLVRLHDGNTIKTNASPVDGRAFIADGAMILGVDPAEVAATKVLSVTQRRLTENAYGFPTLVESDVPFNSNQQGKTDCIIARDSSLVEAVNSSAEAAYAAVTFAKVEIELA